MSKISVLILILMLVMVVPVIAADCDPLTTEDSMGFCVPNPTPTQWVSPTPTIIETITTMITEIITPTPTSTPTSTPTPTPTPTPEPVYQPTPEPTIPIFLKEGEVVTEEEFVLKPESESEIIVKDPPATVVVKPILSSGEVLEVTDIKEYPTDKLVTSIVESTRSGIVTSKTVQIYPESVLEVSNNAETIKQSSDGNVKLELYYGYQTDNKPWSQYYKVEGCENGICRVVRADFDTKQVWIESVTEAEINGIVGIPAYGDLP